MLSNKCGENRQLQAIASRVAGATLALGIALAPHGVDHVHAFTEEQKLIAEAWRVVDQGYIDRTFNHQDWFKVRMKAVKHQYNSREEAYATIKKMLASLNDPYTRFLSPDQLESLTSTTTGELAGIGITFFPGTENGLQILSVEDGGPAAKSGLKAKDKITEIDGEETEELSPDEAAARIRGEPGTLVSVTVDRSSESKTFNIERRQLRIKSVVHELQTSPSGRKVGYIRIKAFNAGTADDAREAVEDLKRQGAEEYVLDLRNNPGGYFPAGVEVARLFLDQGATIAYVVNNRGIQDEYQNGTEATVHEPLVVLVNKATASASEVLAGALKDNNRAVLVGEKTFGKGVVQTVSPLSDGSGLAVTIAKYETPKHNEVNKIGIAPNISRTCPDEASFVTCLPDGF